MYLIVAGSLAGYTAFVWLLERMPASRVASHAFVNPIVALALGYFVASEEITLDTLLGAGLVVGSVVLTLKGPTDSSRIWKPDEAVSSTNRIHSGAYS